MNIHEYQAKELLAKFGVPVPAGFAAFSVDEAVAAAEKLPGPLYVVKAEEHDTPFYRVLHQELDDRYGVEQTIGAVEIWRRRDR